MRKVSFEIEIPETADMVLEQQDYNEAAAKIAVSIKEQMRSQFGGEDQALTAEFLRELMLIGLAFEGAGLTFKSLCAKYAERGRFKP